LNLKEKGGGADGVAGAGAFLGALAVSRQGALLGAHQTLHVALLGGHAPLLALFLLLAPSCSCRRRWCRVVLVLAGRRHDGLLNLLGKSRSRSSLSLAGRGEHEDEQQPKAGELAASGVSHGHCMLAC
jgi:hypothetical protein